MAVPGTITCMSEYKDGDAPLSEQLSDENLAAESAWETWGQNLYREKCFYSYQHIVTTSDNIGVPIPSTLLAALRARVGEVMQTPWVWEEHLDAARSYAKGLYLADLFEDLPPMRYEDVSLLTTRPNARSQILYVYKDRIHSPYYHNPSMFPDEEVAKADAAAHEPKDPTWHCPGLTTFLAGELILLGAGWAGMRGLQGEWLLDAYDYAQIRGWDRPKSSLPDSSGHFTQVQFTHPSDIAGHPANVTGRMPPMPNTVRVDPDMFKPY